MSDEQPTSTPDASPGLVAQAGPFATILFSLLWVHRHFEELPEKLPIHWNARFHPDHFVPRSAAVTMPILLGAVLCLGMLGMQAGLRRSATPGPLRAATVKTLLAGEYFTALLCCGILVATATNGRLLKPVLVLAAVGVLAFLIFSWISLRGVPRQPVHNPSGWRGGLFYVDREDPALFVPKRSGLGYTFNFGHPAALPLTVGLLGLPFLILALVALLR